MVRQRANKYVAEFFGCSRREADILLTSGWVYQSNEKHLDGSIPIEEGTQLSLSKEGRAWLSQKVTIIVNKPLGFVSNLPEDNHPTAMSLLKKENFFGKSGDSRLRLGENFKNLAPAGRLDIDSQGLLVYTQDGSLARKIIGGDSVEKEYIVHTSREVSEEDLHPLRRGLETKVNRFKPCNVTKMSKLRYQVFLREGKKRQIRHMFGSLGVNVTFLQRVRIGEVKLGSLPVGKWRFLENGEFF